ncbi:MAG TPA: ATP-binding protein [Candidatus Acidoferrales bacterium]|nr:ATP-binding protein [Candidatus Acidoferrales bacterium]
MGDERQVGQRLQGLIEASGSPHQTLEVLAHVLERLPQAVAVLDVADDGLRILYANLIAEDLMGIRVTGQAGMPQAKASSGDQEVLRAVLDIARQTAQTGGACERLHVPPSSDGRQSWNWIAHPLLSDGQDGQQILVTGSELSGPVRPLSQFREAADLGLRIMLEISREAARGGDLDKFIAGISASIARLLGAGRVAFGLFHSESGVVALHPGTHGIGPDQFARVTPFPAHAAEHDLAYQVVFEDHVIRTSMPSGAAVGSPDAPLPELAVLDPSSILMTAWRAGDERLGALVALDSFHASGFSEEDALVLKMAGRAAGLLYQRKRAELLLADRTQKVEELESAKSQFMRMAAHELRGPVAVLRGYFSMLHQGRLDGEALNKLLPLLDHKLVSMEEVLEKMLESARLEDGRLDLNLSDAVLADLVRGAIDYAFKQHPGHGQPTSRLEAGAVIVTVDPYRIRFVISNLIDNALKYSPKDSLPQCWIEADSDEFRVSVRDQGPGISDHVRDRLFCRFERLGADESGKVAGIGLGLWLSREMARKHGGELTLDCTSGEGSTFTLHLPRQQATPPGSRPHQTSALDPTPEVA